MPSEAIAFEPEPQIDFTPESVGETVDFTPEQVPSDTPSLLPVLNDPGLPQFPVEAAKPAPQFAPFKPLPAEAQVPQIGTSSGENDSLLGFLPEIPPVPEPIARAIGGIPLVGGASIGAPGVKVAAGAGNAAIGMAKGITTPMALALFGGGPMAAALRPIFAGQMAAGAVQAVPETIQALREGDIQKAAQTGVGGVLSGVLAGHLAETPLDRIVRDIEASPTPITAGTVAAMREAAVAEAGGPKPGMVRIFDTGAPEARPLTPVSEIPQAAPEVAATTEVPSATTAQPIEGSVRVQPESGTVGGETAGTGAGNSLLGTAKEQVTETPPTEIGQATAAVAPLARRQISKGEFEKELKTFPKDSQWVSTVRKGVMLSSGDRGIVETFSLNGQPIYETHVANNHQFSRVYRIEPNAPIPEPPQATAGETPAEVAAAETTPEATLSAGLEKLPAKSPTLEAVKEHIEEQQKLGIVPTPPPVVRGTPLLDVAKGVINEVRGIKKFTPFRETLNKWVGTVQESDLKVRELNKMIESRVPSAKKRAAITNWIQADGDATVLADRARATKNRKLQDGYVDATRLTPDEIAVAREIQTFYANKAVELQDAGVLKDTVDNYVTQIWKREPGTGTAAQFAGKLAKNFKFSRQRTFGTFFEGEQAGYKPATKDISKLAAVYSAEADKVLATRQMISDLTQKTYEDGRPLAVPSGIAKTNADTEPGARLVFPSVVGKDFSDYKDIGHPALSKWKWVETDPETGVNTMVLGSLKVHPKIAPHIRNALDRPWLRKWYDEPGGPTQHLAKMVMRGLDTAGGTMKRTMLSASPFHIVQEGTHALFHRVDPAFGLPDIKAGDPKIQDAMNHGLMLAGEHTAAEQFREGITGGGLLSKVPGIGPFIDRFSDWTFKQYIPKLKYATYEKMVARNTKVFAKELASKEVTPDDVKALSAEQSNAAYGHLNYADMGRNPNFQHFLRTVLLAPDFLEARGRFAAQAAKGIVSKTGREQLSALAFGAAMFWMAARVGNQISSGDPHYDRPFEVKIGNRWFSMRSVPEDMFKLVKDTRQFINGRLSPMFGQTFEELRSGRNYRGEKVTTPEALGEMMTRWIPISFRNIPGLRSLSESTRQNPVSPWESFLGTAGLHISRYSPITETYKLAADYNKAHNVPVDRGTYPVSKYQQLRYALEDVNFGKAREEVQKLRVAGLSADKIRSGFKESVMHPFTQNKATDDSFRSTLKGRDRVTYDEAVRLRTNLVDRLDQIVR